MEPSAITDADARRAGYPSAAALVADLRGAARPCRCTGCGSTPSPSPIPATSWPRPPTCRPTTWPSSTGASTGSTGQSRRPVDGGDAAGIAERPAVRAADLAESFGRETRPFKLDVAS